MSTLPVIKNQKVPLRFQLHDNDETKIILVTIHDVEGNVLTPDPIELTHIGEGLYVDFSFDMPDKTIIATYTAYLQDKITPSSEHGSAEDTFYNPEITKSFLGSFINLGVVGTIQDNFGLIGYVNDKQKVYAEIIEDQKVIGVVEDEDDTKGSVLDNNEILGILEG